MAKTLRFVFCTMMLSFMTLLNNTTLNAQILTKSEIITEYNGKQYYLHTVQRKQSLKNIAKLYGVPLNEILINNKGLRNNPKVGTIVRIPYYGSPVEELPHQEVDSAVSEVPYTESYCVPVFNPDKLYRIALMIPLYLEQVDSEFINQEASNKMLLEKPFSFLHFYEGFMIAVDSMVNSRGLKLDLKIYDIDQDTNKVMDAINDTWLANADIIIGPFYIKPFEKISAFASQHDIMIVNPLTNRDEIIKGNRNIVKVKPSFSSQLQWLSQLIEDRYKDNSVFVFGMDTANTEFTGLIGDIARQKINKYSKVDNRHIVKLIKKRNEKLTDNDTTYNENEYYTDNYSLDLIYLEENIDDSTIFENQVVNYVYSIDSLNKIVKKASTVRNNLVIVYGDDKVFATEIVNKVNIMADEYPLTLVAMPDWSRFDRLFNENLMRMNTIYFDDEYIDYELYKIMRFISLFRNKYGSEPNDMAYHGFNIGWYFINALMNYSDNIINCISSYSIPLLGTKYYFSRKSADDGFVNEYWNLYQFKNYEKVPFHYE